jgi:hypothetical protein
LAAIQGSPPLRKPSPVPFQLAQANPIFSIKHASSASKLSFPTASVAIQRLTNAGILQESSGKRRDRLFVYAKCLEILNRDL